MIKRSIDLPRPAPIKLPFLVRILAIFTPIVFLVACGKPAPETLSPAGVMTAAAETAEAMLIFNATHLPEPSPTITPTLLPSPTPTILINATFGPTPIVTLTPIPTSPGCDVAGFVADITIEDGTELPAGTPFTKIWELRNEGTCTWTEAYSVISYNWQTLGGPDTQQLTIEPIPPGHLVQVSVDLVAPLEPGRYVGYWLLRNAAGVEFGIGPDRQPFYVEIVVVPATSTPTATLNITLAPTIQPATATNTVTPSQVALPTDTPTPSTTPTHTPTTGNPYP